MTEVVERIRAGGGPVFVEAATYRWHGRYEGDPEKYRSKDELSEWQQRDPLVITRTRLLGRGVEQERLDEVKGPKPPADYLIPLAAPALPAPADGRAPPDGAASRSGDPHLDPERLAAFVERPACPMTRGWPRGMFPPGRRSTAVKLTDQSI